MPRSRLGIEFQPPARVEDHAHVKAIITCIARLECASRITPATRKLAIMLLSEYFYEWDDRYRELDRRKRGRRPSPRALVVSRDMHRLVLGGLDQKSAAKKAAKQHKLRVSPSAIESMTRRYRAHRGKGLLAGI